MMAEGLDPPIVGYPEHPVQVGEKLNRVRDREQILLSCTGKKKVKNDPNVKLIAWQAHCEIGRKRQSNGFL